MGMFDLFKKFPSSIVTRVQSSKVGKLWQLYSEKLDEFDTLRISLGVLRDINSAEGVILDRIGDIVGETRDGREDQEYRLFVKIAIAKNLCGGSIPEIITIAKLISIGQTFKITELHDLPVEYFLDGDGLFNGSSTFYPGRRREGAFEIEFEGDIHTLTLPKGLTKAVNQIRAAGIKGTVRALLHAPNSPSPTPRRATDLVRTNGLSSAPEPRRVLQQFYTGKPMVDASGTGLMDGGGLWDATEFFSGTSGIAPTGVLVFSEVEV